MSVLVTGGAGFVGLNLCQALLRAGHEVVLFDRQAPSLDFNAWEGGERLRVVVGDLCSAEDVAAVFRSDEITHVFHGAAITSGPERDVTDPETILQVNVLGTLNVLRSAAQALVQRFVYPSSLSVYGASLYRHPELSEDTTPPVPASLYGITKYASERLVLVLGRQLGLNVVAARIGSVFGPWERDTGVRDQVSPYAQVARLALLGEQAILPGDYPRRQQIYALDLANALVTLMFAPRLGYDVYNASADLDWTQTFESWCERLVERFPGFAYRQADAACPANVDYHDTRLRGDLGCARLRADLGWQPTYAAGAALDDYADWLAAHRDYFI